MLSTSQRSRLCVVLVGARNPGNIGAAARAMHDFGFADLRFVSDYAVPLEAAQVEAATKAAVASSAVLQGARSFTSVADAVSDCVLTIGTTAVGGRTLEQPLVPLVDGAGVIAQTLSRSDEARVALLFGSEKTGLTRDQLSHCSLLTTIPMYAPEDARHLSMNLGQSVAVCLYELARGGFEGAALPPVTVERLATGEDRERLTQLLQDVMQATEYSRRFPANAQEHLVRRLAHSAGHTHAEAESWMGIFRQVLWSSRQSARISEND